jgi:hypothetical protein
MFILSVPHLKCSSQNIGHHYDKSNHSFGINKLKVSSSFSAYIWTEQIFSMDFSWLLISYSWGAMEGWVIWWAGAGAIALGVGAGAEGLGFFFSFKGEVRFWVGVEFFMGRLEDDCPLLVLDPRCEVSLVGGECRLGGGIWSGVWFSIASSPVKEGFGRWWGAGECKPANLSELEGGEQDADVEQDFVGCCGIYTALEGSGCDCATGCDERWGCEAALWSSAKISTCCCLEGASSWIAEANLSSRFGVLWLRAWCWEWAGSRSCKLLELMCFVFVGTEGFKLRIVSGVNREEANKSAFRPLRYVRDRSNVRYDN